MKGSCADFICDECPVTYLALSPIFKDLISWPYQRLSS